MTNDEKAWIAHLVQCAPCRSNPCAQEQRLFKRVQERAEQRLDQLEKERWRGDTAWHDGAETVRRLR